MKATALEILSEPLTLLVLLASTAIAVLAPAFHCHQFGEPARMARDAGLSAVFTGSLAVAVFGVVRSLRREIESGTLETALAHSVCRRTFLLSKMLGAFAACCVFAATVFSVALVMIAGADAGAAIAARSGDIARIWGPCAAAGTAVAVVPLAIGAALNRFARFRFVLSANISAAVLSAVFAAAAFFMDTAALLRHLPAIFPIISFMLFFTAVPAAFAVRLRANAAVAFSAVVFALAMPFAGNYYPADALANGGVLEWSFVALAALAALPAAAAFAIAGIGLFENAG